MVNYLEFRWIFTPCQGAFYSKEGDGYECKKYV